MMAAQREKIRHVRLSPFRLEFTSRSSFAGIDLTMLFSSLRSLPVVT